MGTPISQFALVIDDEPSNRDVMERMLHLASFSVAGAASATEALNLIRTLQPLSLVIIDRQLPDMDGIDLLARLRSGYPDTLLIMATVQDDDATVERAFRLGCDIFLVKPYGLVELVTKLRNHTFERSDVRLIGDRNGLHPYRGFVGGIGV